jgi:hypothetical protein
MSQSVEIEKSAVRVWLLALLGVPFLLIGADLFFERKLIGVFGDLVYGGEELPAFEPRDTIIAALFIIGGAALTLWGLKELVFPKKVLVADPEGVRLAVAGPFRPAVLIRWVVLTDVKYEMIDAEGDLRPALRIKVMDRTGLPDHPWGARWVGSNELLVDAIGWTPPASGIVDSLLLLRDDAGAETADEE